MEQNERLIRVWRVAQNLDVSRKRVYQMVQEGKLTAQRLGPREMRIVESSLTAFISQRNEKQMMF
ncbi:TPA: hypothetical protein DDW35_00490 [Candidatus Sumerlaeota bacterium]|jgi:excisionase family DNA binding protein|nr:hypothetical protein [Candidatus Sumerlaeota bacterium]